MSLKVMLKKFVHKGQITQEEYDALIKKLEGHDKEVRAKAIEDFAEKVKGNFFYAVYFADNCFKKTIDEIAEQLKECEE